MAVGGGSRQAVCTPFKLKEIVYAVEASPLACGECVCCCAQALSYGQPKTVLNARTDLQNLYKDIPDRAKDQVDVDLGASEPSKWPDILIIRTP